MMAFFSIVGALIITALLVAMAAAMVGWAATCLTNYVNHIRYDAKLLAQKELGVQLLRDSYWFSESKDAEYVLRVIGEELRDGNHYSVSQARNKWEEMRKK